MIKHISNVRWRDMKANVKYTNQNNPAFIFTKLETKNGRISGEWKFIASKNIYYMKEERQDDICIVNGTMEVKEPIHITIGDLV